MLEYQKFLYLSATSQDIIDTGLMVYLSSVLTIIELRLKSLIDLLDRMQKVQSANIIMAHTRMQVALPFIDFDTIQQWKSLLKDIIADFGFYRKNILRLQLAGSIGNGASY